MSAVLWFFAALAVWHLFGASNLHSYLSFLQTPELAEGEKEPFLTSEKLWSYLYISLTSFLFCVVWLFIERHRWFRCSNA